ncbi:precorrin-3B C(17)-methyltransferase [Comamonas composti]|uniref:precorrin-3B C(17)-methyltransferase n=1 Tax=Comamonas composti TaxID=408558 RepID=UPI00040F9A8D|nr:precorrin-3B C(17)-methyltransferase [Comamonas composti]
MVTPHATMGRLCIAGLGPGDLAQITPAVREALLAADDVVGYFPYVARAQALLAQEAYTQAPAQAVQWHASDNRVELDRARQALALAAQGRQVVVVSSGDPGVFAMASAVFEALEAADAPPAWLALDIEVLPGVTAMLAAAARAGAPLGHDFCCINLSDNLKPWAVIARRVQLAAEADFAMAFYNPRSRSRPEGFVRLLELLRAHCEPERLLIFARAVSTPDEALQVCTLEQARPEMADMRTVVLVGNSSTRRVGRWVYTPRYYDPVDAADVTSNGSTP